MAKFKKGKSGNPEGRPAGTPNKTTAEIKEAITVFISNNIDSLQDVYDCLDAEKKILLLEKLMKFVIAPIKPTFDNSDENASLNIINLGAGLDPFARIRENAGIEPISAMTTVELIERAKAIKEAGLTDAK